MTNISYIVQYMWFVDFRKDPKKVAAAMYCVVCGRCPEVAWGDSK